MVLDDLGSSLRGTLKKIASAVTVDAKLIKEIVRDIQRALLQADVNVKLVLELSKTIEKRALSEKPPAGMSNREHVIHIVNDVAFNAGPFISPTQFSELVTPYLRRQVEYIKSQGVFAFVHTDGALITRS